MWVVAMEGGDNNKKKKSQGERETGGQEVRGQRVQRPRPWACGSEVTWLYEPRAECQAD